MAIFLQTILVEYFWFNLISIFLYWRKSISNARNQSICGTKSQLLIQRSITVPRGGFRERGRPLSPPSQEVDPLTTQKVAPMALVGTTRSIFGQPSLNFFSSRLPYLPVPSKFFKTDLKLSISDLNFLFLGYFRSEISFWLFQI